MATTSNEERVTDRPPPGGGTLQPAETAPSIMREDEPTFPRTLGMIGAALVIFGGMALAFNLSGRMVRVSTGWSVFLLTLGMAGLLFHAAFDRDVQFRRMYMAFGIATLALGAALCLIPYPRTMGDQFRYAVPCLFVSLLFFLAFLRNETEEQVRDLASYAPQERVGRAQPIPLGRPTTPNEVAGLVAFLASADADYMTGQAINFDGGMIVY